MSNNILNDISSVYVAEVLEPKLKAGGEGKKVQKGGTSEEDSAKRVSQAVYDIRYKAKKSGVDVKQAFSKYSGKSGMSGEEIKAVREKLGISEELERVDEEEEKYKVRVRDKETGKTYVRSASREKIASLRSNPTISSVEMTGEGKVKDDDKKKKGKLDPVGQEDKDIDNDGDVDKTDKYLHKRRKAIGSAIASRKEEVEIGESKHEVPDKDLKKMSAKATKRVDSDVDGDVDDDDAKEKGFGEYLPSADGKKKIKTKVKIEGFYSWRDSLSEVADEMDKKVKEKKVKNKIKIHPNSGMNESIQNLGGELLEMEEFSGVFDDVLDVDFYHISDELIESVVVEFYEEILAEGYDLLEVRKAIIELIDIEMSILDEAKVTVGHDSNEVKRSKMDRVKSFMKKAYKKGKEAYNSKEGKRVRKGVKKGLYRVAKRVSNLADKAAERLTDVSEGNEESEKKQSIAAREKMMKKQQMLDRQRLQMQKAGKLPAGHAYEEVESEDEVIEEKAVSKAQQRFMGMVHAVKKGDMSAPSSEVAKAVSSMKNKDAKDFASTKHKGLPDKKEVDEATRYAQETGKSFKSGKERVPGGSMKNNKAFQNVSKTLRSMQGRPEGQKEKVKGKKPPAAGELGGPKSPAQKVDIRRSAAKRAKEQLTSRFD